MKINEIEIPDSEIEKLSGTKRRILYALYEAHPDPIKIGDLIRAGGSGCQTRRKSLNEDFLSRYGLTIEGKPVGTNENGTQVWQYSLKRISPVFDAKGQGALFRPEEGVKAL